MSHCLMCTVYIINSMMCTLYISWTVWRVHCTSHFLMCTYIYCELYEVYTVCQTVWCTVYISWTVWHFLCMMYWNSMIYSLCSTSKNIFVAKGLTFNFSDHRSERQLLYNVLYINQWAGIYLPLLDDIHNHVKTAKCFFYFLPANNECAIRTESQWRGWTQMGTYSCWGETHFWFPYQLTTKWFWCGLTTHQRHSKRKHPLFPWPTIKSISGRWVTPVFWVFPGFIFSHFTFVCVSLRNESPWSNWTNKVTNIQYAAVP